MMMSSNFEEFGLSEVEKMSSKLFIYPLKGAGGLEVADLQLNPQGLLQGDREISIIQNGKIVNARQIPGMAAIKLSGKTAGMYELSYPGSAEKLYIPKSAQQLLESGFGIQESVDFKAHSGSVMVCSRADVNDWLADHLQVPDLSLAYHVADWERPVDPRYLTSGANQVAFGDNAPLLAISKPDLEQIFGPEARAEVFRANIVLPDQSLIEYFQHGLKADGPDESAQKFCTIDGHLFRIAPCQRCNVINIDPDAGKVAYKNLVNLRDYNACFGCYLIPMSMPENGIQIRQGSKVELGR